MTLHLRPFLVATVSAAFLLAVDSSVRAEPLTYTAFSGSLGSAPGQGPGGGQYILGGVTNTFSGSATATFTATADSTAVVSATSSADSGSLPLYYNLVGTITITIVDGATTINLTAGTQNGTLQPAAYSTKYPSDAYSFIGFGLIDVSSPYTTANPNSQGFAYEFATGTSFYGDLASPGTFDGPYYMIIVGSIEVTSGAESGILTFNNGYGFDPSFKVESVPEPSTYALFLLGAGALYVWKRQKGLGRS